MRYFSNEKLFVATDQKHHSLFQLFYNELTLLKLKFVEIDNARMTLWRSKLQTYECFFDLEYVKMTGKEMHKFM